MGRTTNQLKRCIKLAQGGKMVFFVAENLEKAFDTIQRCTTMLLTRNAPINYRRPLTLEFAGAGSIRFVSMGDASDPFTLAKSGLSPMLRAQAFLIYDHHAHYLIGRARRQRDAVLRIAAE